MADVPGRYLLAYSYVPDEASWCTCATFKALATKAHQLWDIQRCAFVYYVTAQSGKAVAIKVCAEVDFQLWYRGGNPLTGRLIAHDLTTVARVTHSTGHAPMSHRPLIDTFTLQDLKGLYTLRHSITDETILIGADESPTWAVAVERAQLCWQVHRPLFRYVDSASGERIVISIVDADDFAMWARHRRPMLPELSVFEHAAPQLLDQSPDVAYVAGAPEPTKPSGPSEATKATEKSFEQLHPQLANNPPQLRNPHHASRLEGQATGRPEKVDAAAAERSAGEANYDAVLGSLHKRAGAGAP